MENQRHNGAKSSCLDIIIVGAGIGGLSAAIALRRAGHNITIIEKSSMTNEVGAAIHVCPNASRILLPWGLDATRARFVEAKSFLLAHGASMKPMVDFSYQGTVEKYGAPCYFAHRVDLHDELKRLALGDDGPGKPPKVRLRTEVVDYDPEGGVVKLSDGSEVKGDLIIGADGIHSKAVEYVLGKSVPAVSSGSSCFRFLIPTEDLLNDPETAPMMVNHDGKFRAYVNTESDRVVWYPCRDNTIQNVAFIHADIDEKDEREDWNRSATQETLLKALKGFDPSIIAACKKTDDIKLWKLLFREPLSTWHRSRLVVIGDAAHPMLPHQGQAGAQAIEDSAALGTLFENFGSNDADSISKRLDLFEKVRKNRASAIQMFSSYGQDQFEKSVGGAKKYIPDGQLPKGGRDFEDFNYIPNVVEDCKKALRSVVV